MSPQDGSFQKLRNCLQLLRLCRENCGLFFSGHVVLMNVVGSLTASALVYGWCACPKI